MGDKDNHSFGEQEDDEGYFSVSSNEDKTENVPPQLPKMPTLNERPSQQGPKHSSPSNAPQISHASSGLGLNRNLSRGETKASLKAPESAEPEPEPESFLNRKESSDFDDDEFLAGEEDDEPEKPIPKEVQKPTAEAKPAPIPPAAPLKNFAPPTNSKQEVPKFLARPHEITKKSDLPSSQQQKPSIPPPKPSSKEPKFSDDEDSFDAAFGEDALKEDQKQLRSQEASEPTSESEDSKDEEFFGPNDREYQDTPIESPYKIPPSIPAAPQRDKPPVHRGGHDGGRYSNYHAKTQEEKEEERKWRIKIKQIVFVEKRPPRLHQVVEDEFIPLAPRGDGHEDDDEVVGLPPRSDDENEETDKKSLSAKEQSNGAGVSDLLKMFQQKNREQDKKLETNITKTKVANELDDIPVESKQEKIKDKIDFANPKNYEMLLQKVKNPNLINQEVIGQDELDGGNALAFIEGEKKNKKKKQEVANVTPSEMQQEKLIGSARNNDAVRPHNSTLTSRPVLEKRSKIMEDSDSEDFFDTKPKKKKDKEQPARQTSNTTQPITSSMPKPVGLARVQPVQPQITQAPKSDIAKVLDELKAPDELYVSKKIKEEREAISIDKISEIIQRGKPKSSKAQAEPKSKKPKSLYPRSRPI